MIFKLSLIFMVLTTSSMVLGAQDMRILHGTYIQPSVLEKWTGPESFRREYGYMKELQMDHFIIQWLANSKSMQAWYPTSLEGYKVMTSYDTVEAALSEAEKAGLTVWLGLNDNDDWWVYSATNETWLEQQFEISKQFVQDLWTKYGARYGKAIAGFYPVFEMDNMAFLADEEQMRMARMYKGIADYVHELTKKPVMIAPYYDEITTRKWLDPIDHANMWKRILTVANIDIIALQDGVGVNHTVVPNVAKWFYYMRIAVKQARPSTQLWSDLETFIDLGDENLIPAPVSRVIQQIQVEYRHVDKITSFSFSMLDSPQQGHEKEFLEYKKYFLNH